MTQSELSTKPKANVIPNQNRVYLPPCIEAARYKLNYLAPRIFHER